MNRSRTFFKSLVVALFLGASLAFGSHAFAQVVDPTSGLETFGQAAGFVTTGSLTLTIARLIRTVITLLGILAVIFVMYGGFSFMTAGGNDDKVKRARKILTSAVIGLVIVLSSFAIVQFVLGQLSSALESGGTTTDGSDGYYPDGTGGSTGVFELTSVNTDCADAIMNFQPQFTFSQRVSAATVDAGGIVITTPDGTPVEGTYAVSGQRVTFTPSMTCELFREPDEHCFMAAETYTVFIDSSVLESTGGRSLTCGTECQFDFTTGAVVDTVGPDVSMDAPETGATAYVTDIQDLWSYATDDSGVSSLDFTVDGDTVYQTVLSTDSTEGALSPENYFHIADGTQWDTAGYSADTYQIRAEGADCAGHTDTSAAISLVLRPAHCGNDVADEDDPLTATDESDTAENCGGDECGACDDTICTDSSECASGYCDPVLGLCTSVPEIEEVSPGDGAEMSLITISGSSFGTTPGSVTFLGDTASSADDIPVSAYECDGITQWGDEQIVVQVPTGAVDGPIQLTTADGYRDETDDEYGPSISDFDVNAIERPGLCSLTPTSGLGFSTVSLMGLAFGADQGSSTVYFGSSEAYDYSAWTDEAISAVLPLLNAREYQTQVWAGDYVCLDAAGDLTSTTCLNDGDCVTAGYVSCHLEQCSDTLADCSEDSDCTDGAECVSVRQGSNELSFTVVDASSEEVPVVSSTDSGWSACSDGTHCGEDGECSSGTCDAADNWGPPGQYVTIYGSGFGTNTGTVHFSDDLGYANGEMDAFPDACGDDFWDDTQITVKVPANYTNLDSDGDGEGDPITSFGTFSLTVETAAGSESDGYEFVIRDDEPGPGVCNVDPVSGPAGVTVVTIDGDNFGSAGNVEFYSGERVTDFSSTNYWNNTQIQATVPTDAETGPVFVTSDAGFDSNSQSFEVSDCGGDDANCSVTGTVCCANGSCAVSCEEGEVANAHYAWMFSTADIPEAPRVLTYCGDRDDDGSYDGVSPGPSNGWSVPADICVNTAVTATFDTVMDTSTFDANIHVTTADGTAVAGATVPSATPYTFTWIPTDNDGEFLPNTAYTVTLDAAGIRSADGVAMLSDYAWEFTTASSTDPCAIGSVYASPSSYIATSANETIDYLAQPISAEDECVPLACTDYAWTWTSSGDPDTATVDPETVPVGDACVTTATALAETFGSPVDITATATNPDGRDPEDSGELTINFTDPAITSWTPSCDTACVNGAIDFAFNTAMEDTFDAGDTVRLFACDDSLCDTVSEGEEFTGAYSASYNSVTRAVHLAHDNFAAGTWYRVVVDGGVTSTSGVALSESGSNYPSEDNRYYRGDYSWTFKTKNSDEPCDVDRVEVTPSNANDTYIGQQNLWEALPYGAPDDCSSAGQELDASDYTWSPWTATDSPDVHVGTNEVAEMIESGSLQLTSDLESGCSSDCLHLGSAATTEDAVCGNGTIEYGEECDGGSGCSSDCLHEAATQCDYACALSGASCDTDADCTETCDASGSCTINTSHSCTDELDCPYADDTCEPGSGCCGDGTRDAGEECDDGDDNNANACSNSCLNNGARKSGTICGDGTRDWSGTTGGEDCDDGNTRNGDGCSSDCLYEGGVAVDGIYATCGNGTVEVGEDCEDASTDSDKVDDGDGCSSECLYEGASVCAYECQNGSGATNGESCSGLGATTCPSGYTCQAAVSPCCGDGTVDYSSVTDAWADRSEDCDDGNADDGDGCSSACLSEGSNENYSTLLGGPSYCGDGTVDHTSAGAGGEECDAATGYTYDVTNWGVSRIKDAAAQEVIDGQAGSVIGAGVTTPLVTGSAALTLSCSCDTDASCGEESTYGCGTGSCCFARPEEADRYPASGATDICRNTSVYVDFTDAMDAASYAPEGGAPNLYLLLTSMDSGATTVTESNCPYEDGWAQVSVGSGRASSSWIARAFDWIVSSVRQLFGGQPAIAAATYGCVVPVSYDSGSNDVNGTRVALTFDDALVANATYQLVVNKDTDVSDADAEGVLSVNGVSVALAGSTATAFETGNEICELNVVEVEDLGTVASLTDELADPSVGYFTDTGETHQLSAAAYTVAGGSLQPISETSSYGWSWTWGTSVTPDTTDGNVISVTTSDATTIVATAAGTTGRESAEAQANFLSTNTFGDTSGGVNGSVSLVANVCDNPPTIGFPYTDSTSNFSFFYCRDAGVVGDASDDLPQLETPVDVTSYTGDIIQELIFPVSGTSDAIGVRVLQNTSYQSPLAWYEAQGFTGSPTPTTVDGYEAVRDGNTTYVAAANDSTWIYPNIYVISYTENADAEAQEIFDQVLENWTFNANADVVTDVNLCVDNTGAYPTVDGAFVSCDWDGDCAIPGLSATCDAEKAKLTRDMRRLTDVTDLIAMVNAYAESNGFCSSTTEQTCTVDSECPGSETCEPATPKLQSGTFVAPYSMSSWPSWSATLGNALGSALPEDPVNAYDGCTDTGYESETCWNATSSTFSCPSGSHVYGYKSLGGTAYELNAQLEYGGSLWRGDIEPSGSFETLNVSQPYTGSSTPQDGFVRASADTFCDGDAVGTDAICGDGIVGSGEDCEIGQTTSIDCASGGGTITVTCNADCVSGYQTQTEAEAAGAECVPFDCGNGVVEAGNGEDCDDGALNGAYGHCGSDCTTDSAFTCGDGYLAGGEQCDCGTTTTFSSVMSDTASWAFANCDTASNGQWTSDPSVSCSWNCQAPGPSCGDSVVNGSEACDGDYDAWSGALCYGGDDDGEACTTDSECDSGQCGSDGAHPDTYDACGASTTCVGGADEGEACASGATCDSGTCSSFTYDLSRSRTCQASCGWDTATPGGWTDCLGGTQVCGDGTVQGSEECDDGNADDTDACTASCELNVCGDGHVYSGVESCDSGDRNGQECTADYEATCNYCTSTCQYKTTSGTYCGDGVVNGTEFCDGSDVPYSCYDNASGADDRGTTCSVEGSTTECGTSGYTCRWLGVCDGGSKQGQSCTLNPADGSTYATSESDDKNDCGDGECVAPTCADDCSSMCPFSYETASVQAQVEGSGTSPEDSVDLYSYTSLLEPNNATIFIPACSVATGLTADVDTANVTPPSAAIIFLTDYTGTMAKDINGDATTTSGLPSRMDIVSAAEADAIESLYDALGSDRLEIGLIRMYGESFPSLASDDEGYVVDAALGAQTENELIATVEEYALESGLTSYYGPPIYQGMQAAIEALDATDADVKAIIMLSDGETYIDMSGDMCDSGTLAGTCENGTTPTCSGSSASSYNYYCCTQQVDKGLLSSCSADATDGAVRGSGSVSVYTAAITETATNSYAAYMAHMSSETCGTDYDNVSDCETGTYAFSAQNAEGVATMYQSIIDNLLNVTVGVTSDFTGTSHTDTGTVADGHGVSLPFPENFDCDGTDMALPFTLTFNGDGYATLDNIQVTYCPAP